MAVSVWIAWPIVNWFGESISRCRFDTIPDVTVSSKPSGLPIATTGSPTCTSFDWPSGIGVSSASSGSTLSTARSVERSLPTIFAGIGSSSNVTRTSLAPFTTWAFVAM
jgi:hypothetical protein